MLKSLLATIRGWIIDPPQETFTGAAQVAYQQGHAAARKADNPYPPGSRLHHAWDRGFEDFVSEEAQRL